MPPSRKKAIIEKPVEPASVPVVEEEVQPTSKTTRKPREPKEKTTTTKKSRKIFDIDRTVNVDEETEKSITTSFVEKSSMNTKKVVVDMSVDSQDRDDEDVRGGILHIPIPISKDSGLIDSAFGSLKGMETMEKRSQPEPYDPFNMPQKSQNADLEQQNQQQSVTFQNNQKMENTTLSQFFGITVQQQQINNQDNQEIEEEEELQEETPEIIGEGFQQTAGYTVPEESFSVIWRSSQKLGVNAGGAHSVCHWDCHAFTTKPVGIPMRFHKGKFWVRGTYCGWGCAVAAILYDRSKWNYQPYESYALLHLLYRKTHGVDTPSTFFLKPALARETLEMFGGPLSIEKFRSSTHKQDSLIECFTPPFVSLVSTVEEISIEKASAKKKVPFHSRFHQASQQSSAQPGDMPEGRNPVLVPQTGEQNSRPINSIWLGQGLGGSAVKI